MVKDIITQLAVQSVKITTGSGNGNFNFDGPKNADGVLISILNTVYFWAGIVAVIMIIVGGFFYVTANGEQAKITKAKNTVLYSVVGLIIILSAATITQFILGRTS